MPWASGLSSPSGTGSRNRRSRPPQPHRSGPRTAGPAGSNAPASERVALDDFAGAVLPMGRSSPPGPGGPREPLLERGHHPAQVVVEAIEGLPPDVGRYPVVRPGHEHRPPERGGPVQDVRPGRDSAEPVG